MKRKKVEVNVLRILLMISISLLPVIMNKHPRKKWITLYIYHGLTNILMDKILVHKGYISYPTRLLPHFFKIHILFDAVLDPLAMVFYNRITAKNQIFGILYKSLFISVPLLFIETWAERNTNLIKWRKGWNPYFTRAMLISHKRERASLVNTCCPQCRMVP